MGNLQISKKRFWGRESCCRARPDIKEVPQKAQDGCPISNVYRDNMLRISEYTHCLSVSNTSVHLPDFETLCRMIEQYDKTKPVIELHKDDVSESESQTLELTPRLDAWPRDSSPGSVPDPSPASLPEQASESSSEEEQAPDNDVSSESSDGVGFLHDFDKLMRRYSI